MLNGGSAAPRAMLNNGQRLPKINIEQGTARCTCHFVRE